MPFPCCARVVSSEIVIFVALFNLIHISTMAKGNLFLGMGRGSVGDVTFYRANGQQLSRARNRSPRNPKSDAQQIQRAVSATIAQAYKAGKVIFDHAFEGKSVPLGNQRRFLSVNMRKLRSQIFAELATPASEALTSVVSPGSTYTVPNSYRISEGSLIQSLFSLSVADTETFIGPIATMAAANAGETVADYCTRLGLEAGEIFTIVCFGVKNGLSVDDLVSPECSFGFCRLIVKESAITSAVEMTAATYGDFFTIDESGTTFPDTQLVSLGLNLDQIVLTNSGLGSMGVIRSRENSGLRSTSDMLTVAEIDADRENAYGVKPINLLTAWSPDQNGVDSNLILEGGGF